MTLYWTTSTKLIHQNNNLKVTAQKLKRYESTNSDLFCTLLVSKNRNYKIWQTHYTFKAEGTARKKGTSLIFSDSQTGVATVTRRGATG